MATGLADQYRRGKGPALPGGENKYLDQELRKLEGQTSSTLRTLEKLEKEVGDSRALISEERTIRVSENEAFAQQLLTLEARTGDNEAKITEERTVWTTRTESLARAVDTLSASTDTELTKVRAQIVDERLVRTSATEALAQQITTLNASIDNNKASASTQLTALVTDTESLAQRITTLKADFDAEVVDRAADDSALSTRITSAEAAITTEQTARANGDSALAQQITTLTASFNQEVTNRQNGDSALSTRVTSAEAAITSEQTARASADSALAQQITNLTATFNQELTNLQAGGSGSQSTITALTARVATEETARANADSALANQITSVSASATRQRVFRQGAAPSSPQLGDVWYDTNANNIPRYWNGSAWDASGDARIPSLDAAITNEITARASADSALASQISSVSATSNRQRVWAQGSAPSASQVGDLWINTSDNNRPQYWNGSSWVDQADARVSTALSNASTALANVSSEVTARINGDNALSSQISTLTTSVNNATTSVSTLTSSVNGVRGRYGVTINNNGHVSGISLLSDSSNGSPSSIFRISAEQFAIRNPGSSTDSIFWDGIAGRLVVRGDIQATSVTAGSITSTSIVDGQLGREHAYYDPNRVNVSGGAWTNVAETGVSISYGRTVHGTFSMAARQTNGRNGAEHRIRVLRSLSGGLGDYVCWGGPDGAPLTTGYDGTTVSVTFFDPNPPTGTFANYYVQVRTLFGDDSAAFTERSMFLRELSRSEQTQTIVSRTTTLPPAPSGYDGGATYDTPPGTVLP